MHHFENGCADQVPRMAADEPVKTLKTAALTPYRRFLSPTFCFSARVLFPEHLL
jgi:hypothetical protein